jgi:hypothetical protein
MDQNTLYKTAPFCETPKPKFPSTKRCRFLTKHHGPVGEQVVGEDGVDRLVASGSSLTEMDRATNARADRNFRGGSCIEGIPSRSGRRSRPSSSTIFRARHTNGAVLKLREDLQNGIVL